MGISDCFPNLVFGIGIYIYMVPPPWEILDLPSPKSSTTRVHGGGVAYIYIYIGMVFQAMSSCLPHAGFDSVFPLEIQKKGFTIFETGVVTARQFKTVGRAQCVKMQVPC